jgi:hypothetical protein
VSETGEPLVVTVRWRDVHAAWIPPVAAFAGVFGLLVFLALDVYRAVPEGPATVLGIILFAHAVLAAMLTAAALQGLLMLLLNKTTLSVRRGRISVDHGPLVATASTRLTPYQVTELRAERDANSFSRRAAWTVMATLIDGRSIAVLRGLGSEEESQRVAEAVRLRFEG